MTDAKDKSPVVEGPKLAAAAADKRPTSGSQQLTREELEALRRRLQKKFHRS
jgi:hypothetical protein